jgi:hypothetical protein
VVARIEKILGTTSLGDELRAAAAAALADGTPAARPEATQLLRRTVAPSRGIFAVFRSQPPPEERPVVLLAIAHALVALGDDTGRRAVQERAEKCPEPLRSQLLDVVTR